MVENGSNRNKIGTSPQGSVFRILLFLIIASFILLMSCALIGYVLSIIYRPNSSLSISWIIVIMGAALLLIGSQVITHVHHGVVMMPLYLLSSFMLAIWFYLFLISLILFLPILALFVSGVAFHELPVSPFVRVIIPAVLILLILYGTINARYLRRRKVKVLLETAASVRIALISDLHLGLMVGRRRLDAITRTIREERPDMIISAGDLIDTHPRFLKRFESFIRELTTIAPVYAVTGNHEFYNGNQDSIDWMRSLGVKVLVEERTTDEATGLDIIGVSDPSSFGSAEGYRRAVFALAEDQSRDRPFLLISHQPLLFGELAKGHVFLQLCGHTHAGQIWPFGWGTRSIFRDGDRGLHEHNGSFMYVCTGTGTWGPPMRIGTESQMIILDIDNTS